MVKMFVFVIRLTCFTLILLTAVGCEQISVNVTSKENRETYRYWYESIPKYVVIATLDTSAAKATSEKSEKFEPVNIITLSAPEISGLYGKSIELMLLENMENPIERIDALFEEANGKHRIINDIGWQYDLYSCTNAMWLISEALLSPGNQVNEDMLNVNNQVKIFEGLVTHFLSDINTYDLNVTQLEFRILEDLLEVAITKAPN
jgi:hypothetical protein